MSAVPSDMRSDARRGRRCLAVVTAYLRCATLACGLVVAACAPSQARTDPQPSPTQPLQATVQSSASPLARFGQPPSPSPGTTDTLVARAVSDAAERIGAPASEVRVVSVTAREWPD